MASCEKCWADAYHRSIATGRIQAECYSELIWERKQNPCTPEEQAGPDAEECEYCDRMTLHPVLKECRNPDCPYWEEDNEQ
jgi:hypothetical protein